MQKFKIRVFAILTSIVLLYCPAEAQLKAGASQQPINPEGDSLYMAGGKPNRPFIRVRDDLYAKALVVEDGKTSIAIVTFDCIGLMYPELVKIREAVKKRIPDFPTDNIVSSSTHTHSGPDVVGIWGKDIMHSGIVDRHIQLIVDRAAKAIYDAWTSRVPVKVHHASGLFGEGWVKNISEPDLLDRSLTVLQFVNAKNGNVATLANFACHPTILDDFADAASSDYVGGYYRFADSAQGGVNMFLQGAIGGWVQPEDVPSSYENAITYGGMLGKEVMGLLHKAKPLSGYGLNFKSRKINFPLRNDNFRLLSQMGVIKRHFGDSVSSEIAVFSMGEATFITHPGETSPALGLFSRSLVKTGGPVMVMGLALDALGYILKPSYFEKGNPFPHSEYLTGMSIGPQTMPIIENVLKQLTHTVIK